MSVVKSVNSISHQCVSLIVNFDVTFFMHKYISSFTAPL